MGLDPSIILGAKAPDPMESYGRVLQLKQLATQGQLQDAQMQQQRDSLQRQQQLRSLLGGLPASVTDDQRVGALRNAGYFDEADKLQSGVLTRDKTQAEVKKLNAEAGDKSFETTKKRLDVVNGALSSLLARPNVTHDDVYSTLVGMTQNGVLSPEEGARAARSLPGDPAALRSWLVQKGLEAADAKQRLETVMPKLQTINLGGTEQVVDMNPFTRGDQPTSFVHTQSPDNAATVAATVRGQDIGAATTRRGQDIGASTTIRGQNLENARAQGAVTYQTDANGNLVALPTRAFGGPIRGQAVLDASGAPLQGKSNLTEDQGKAAGWLAQANNAYRNAMTAVRNDPGALTQGPGDAIAKIPGMAPVGNMITGENRQRFNQAMSSMSEALLRAATGAGINEYEAQQKIAEITPRFGDSDAVKKQKLDAIPVYLRSLEMRAGPGAKLVGGSAASPAAVVPDAGGLPPDIAAILKKHGGR